MSIAAIFSSGSRSTSAAANNTMMGGLAGSTSDPFTTNITSANEALSQCPAAVAGTLANYYVGIGLNSRTTTTVVWTPRNNGANTAISVTVGAGLTGIFADTSNSATLAQNDLFNAQAVNGNEAASVTASEHGINFTPSSGNTAFPFAACSAGMTASGTGPLTTYLGFASNSAPTATIANAQIATPVAATAKYLYAYVSTNGRSTTSTVKSNINGAAGAQSLSFTSGTTGLIKDTTNTDAVSAGDLLVGQIDLGTGTGNFTLTSAGIWNIATTDGQSAVALVNSAGSAVAAGATISNVLAGRINGNATESLSQGGIPAATLAKMWVEVSANASTTNATSRLRKGAANVNQVVTITALTTGAFQDTTNSDAIAALDLINYQTSGATTGSVTLTAISTRFVVASADITLALTGNAATAAVGTLGTGSLFTLGLTGSAAAAAVGSVTPGLGIGITGNGAAAAPGSVGTGSLFTIPLSGTAATAAVGTVAVSGDVTVALSGVGALAAVGDVTASASGVSAPGGHFLPLTEKQLKKLRARENWESQRRYLEKKADQAAILESVREAARPEDKAMLPSVINNLNSVEDEDDEIEILLLNS